MALSFGVRGTRVVTGRGVKELPSKEQFCVASGRAYAKNVLEDFGNRAPGEFGRLWAVAWRHCERESGEEKYRGSICGAAEGDHEQGSPEGSEPEPGVERSHAGSERGGKQRHGWFASTALCRPTL